MTKTPEMPIDLGLRKRKGSALWQQHIPVPIDLRVAYGGRRELRSSTGTADRREAERIAHRRWCDAVNEFEAARRRQSAADIAPGSINLDLAAFRSCLLTKIEEELLAFDVRTASLSAAARDDLEAFLDAELDGDFRDGGPRPDEIDFTEAALAALALSLDKLAPQSRALALVEGRSALLDLLVLKSESVTDVHRSFAERSRVLQQRRFNLPTALAPEHERSDPTPGAAGHAIETSQLQRPEAARLSDVFKPWKAADPSRHPKHVRDVENALAAYRTFTGDPPLSTLTAAMGDDFRTHLVSLGQAQKTTKAKFEAVKSLLNFAADTRGLISSNPWRNLKVQVKRQRRTEPWKPDEVRALFGSPLFTEYRIPTAAKAGSDAAYWVPLLALFSGARLSELAQLRVSDIALEEVAAGVERLTTAPARPEPPAFFSHPL